MRGAWLFGVGGVAVVAALGCGGAWNEAAAEAVSDQAAEMRGKLMDVAESPERDGVDQLLADIQQQPEGVGIIEFATFGAEVEQAIGDGSIDASELANLQSKHAEIKAP